MPLDGTLVVCAVAAFFAALLSFFAYKAGRVREKADLERKKSKTRAYVRSLRRRLDDPDVVRRLHDTFKR